MRILVTAGPTREFFDSVRFVSNPSSGKMGFAIAAEFVRRGHEVVLVAGPVELPDPKGVEVLRVVSADEMFEAATSRFPQCQAAVMTAAVCDYRPARRLDHKLKKQNRIRPIQLVPTRDICAEFGRTKQDRVVIGFAMEDRNHQENAEGKLKRKRCDAIVLNGLENVAAEAASVRILCPPAGWGPVESGSKAQIAAIVVQLVENLVSRPG
jgi:phosphopantothenoylcysteine decarboxylase/phosphopantothenate--cysteine ligase